MSETESSGAGRWLVALLIMALSGWTAFTIYERLVGRSAPAPTVEKDSRLEAFLDAARAHLDKGELDAAAEQLTKASGVAEDDPRVLEGLATVALLRAERIWWNLAFGKHGSERRKALLRQLDKAVDAARQEVARARDEVTAAEVRSRLARSERRLNAMLVVALALHGDEERARGALAARLAEHPDRELLKQFVDMVARPRPETEEDAGEEEGDAGPGPLAATASPAPPPAPPGSPHYELDKEPDVSGISNTPGELEITVGKKKVEKKVLPSPDP